MNTYTPVFHSLFHIKAIYDFHIMWKEVCVQNKSIKIHIDVTLITHITRKMTNVSLKHTECIN